MENIGTSFAQVLPSFNIIDILVGGVIAGAMKGILYLSNQKIKRNSERAKNTALTDGAMKKILNHIWI